MAERIEKARRAYADFRQAFEREDPKLVTAFFLYRVTTELDIISDQLFHIVEELANEERH